MIIIRHSWTGHSRLTFQLWAEVNIIILPKEHLSDSIFYKNSFLFLIFHVALHCTAVHATKNYMGVNVTHIMSEVFGTVITTAHTGTYMDVFLHVRYHSKPVHIGLFIILNQLSPEDVYTSKAFTKMQSGLTIKMKIIHSSYMYIVLYHTQGHCKVLIIFF